MSEKTKAKEARQLRKITIATVYGTPDVEELIKLNGKSLKICKIWGVAGRMKPGANDFGEFVRFVGDFRAVNLNTGELFRSSVCLLPKFLEEDMAGAMASGADGATKQVEFGVEINVSFDKTAATKYVYNADSLIEPAESQALVALEQKMKLRPAALENKTERPKK